MGSFSGRQGAAGTSQSLLPDGPRYPHGPTGEQHFMLRRSRGGFTLPEMMLSLVVTLMVMGSIYHLLLTTQRTARAQSERVVLQSGVRAGSLIVMNELGELGTVPGGTPEQNDIVAMGPAAVTYRAM